MRGLDIIANPLFIWANEMFQAVTCDAKSEGRGEITSKPVINEGDMKIISDYFINNMKAPSNAHNLQEIVIFNIMYYTGRHGQQNLRKMTKNTFKVFKNPDGRRYLHQVIKELDKNHKEDDLQPSHEARIYESPGNSTF